jgi:tRNA pseudouridine38-40 synthase
MLRFRLTLAYDGTDFHGWQRQDVPTDHPLALAAIGEAAPGRLALRTVQHVVEQAVRQVVREPITIVGASRTDAGVHAQAQCAAFTCSEEARRPPDERLAQAITSRLPPDVVCLACEPAPLDFDPIGGCLAKGYRYAFHTGRTRPLWDRRYVWHTHHELDVARMQEAAAHLTGERDFAALAALDHGRDSTVRTIFACRVSEPAPQRVAIEVSGDGFLYNMVRILAGTLHEAGRGKIEPGDIPDILESKDRRRAGPTLPPEGLRLEWIRYPGDTPHPDMPPGLTTARARREARAEQEID